MFAYLITGPSGKRYVGITSTTVDRRWKRHQIDARQVRSRSALHAAIRLYGADVFTVEKIANFASWREAVAFEVEAIARYNTFGERGYNLTRGGDGKYGCRASEETRLRMSETRKGREVSAEHRANLSLAHQCRTSEARAVLAAKMSAANARRTPEERLRISEAIAASKRGKKRSPEVIAKATAARWGAKLSGG